MRTRSKYLVFAVLVALLLHVFLFDILLNLPEAHPIFKEFSEPQKIQVHLNQNSRPPKQLVQIKPPNEDKIPRKANYVSEFNNSVSKETQNRNKSPKPTHVRRPVATRSPRIAKGPGQKRNLLPTWQDLEQMQQEPETAFNDHIKNVKTGAQTELNTFEWKHASYFNRIKESVARIWAPTLQIKRYDPGAALIGKQDRMTVLEITLDNAGNVTGTEIKNSSGVFYLDDEAIHAFKTASPFPNPPKILFADKDKFSFMFGFVVNIQKGFSLNFD